MDMGEMALTNSSLWVARQSAECSRNRQWRRLRTGSTTSMSPISDATVDRVKTGGGQVLYGPMEVPGGDWIIQGKDPQGAMFALVGKKA